MSMRPPSRFAAGADFELWLKRFELDEIIFTHYSILLFSHNLPIILSKVPIILFMSPIISLFLHIMHAVTQFVFFVTEW